MSGNGGMEAKFWRHLSHPLSCSLAVHGLCEPVALAGEYYNMRVVDQTVNERSREAVVSEDGVPLGELHIGSNDEALAFIAVRDRPEQKFCRILFEEKD